MNLPAKSKKSEFNQLLAEVQQDHPEISFQADNTFRWSAETQTVYYDNGADHAVWTLLHEVGHVISRHSGYHTDGMLVRMEVEAWYKAKELAEGYEMEIDEDYIQDCIDSYRNWQYKRSMCPVCGQTGLEKPGGNYRCFNCRNTWEVTKNRFCRVYRKQARAN